MLVSVLFFLFFLTSTFLAKELNNKNTQFELRFRLRFSYQLLLYLTEIGFVFMLFQFLIGFFGNFLGYKGEGLLKEFIDLFTVYQIFIFVVLKLYDSYKLEPYLAMLYNIEQAEIYMSKNEPIPRSLISKANFVKEYSGMIDFRKSLDLEEVLLEYELYRSSDMKEAKEVVDEIIDVLHFLKSDVQLSIEQIEEHSTISILRRILARKEKKLLRGE